MEEGNVNLQYMKRRGQTYEWPALEDFSWELVDSILVLLSPPKLLNNRGQLQFSEVELNDAKIKCQEENDKIKTVILK